MPDIAPRHAPVVSVKPLDAVGRVRAYGEGLVDGDQFLETCARLDELCLTSGGSRWAVRALVPRHVDVTPDRLGLVAPGGPLEVNRIAVRCDGDDHDYLWVARNLHDRGPDESEVARFVAAVDRLCDYQEGYLADFGARAESLLSLVHERKLRLVCHDPQGEWGQRQVHPDVFAAALHQLFYFSHDDAARMVEGSGYSRHGHYVFGLEDDGRELLAMFVLAQFDWGFEGTYTMVNSTLSARRTAGAARLLMLLANALVLGRHGPDTVLYGEANLNNIKACISAGYTVIPPRLTVGVHENVVWRDNPIGRLVGTDPHIVVQPPSYHQEEYVDYALMQARNEVILPYVAAAQDLIA